MDQRTCYILKIILQNKADFITGQGILDLLESEYNIYCNVKTIRTDVSKINTFFEEIFGIDSFVVVIKKKGYVVNNELLGLGQIRFIYDLLNSSLALSQKESEQLFKIFTALSSYNMIESLNLPAFDDNNRGDILTTINTINKAILDKKAISFGYVSYSHQNGEVLSVLSNRGNMPDNKEKYLVSPYEITIRAGKYYLIAYNDIDPMSLRIYRLDRMRSVQSSKRYKFIDKRDEFDTSGIKKNTINMFFSTKESDITFQFDPKIFRTIVDQFGTNIKIEKLNNNYLRATVENVAINDGLIGWIMMLGDKIRIERPTELINKIKKQLVNLAQYYEIG